MGGLLFVLALAAWIGVTWWLVVRRKRRWAKVLVIVVSLVALIGDEVWGRIRLAQMCRADGGLRIYRIAENVDGIGVESAPTGGFIRRLGFRFEEAPDFRGGYKRLVRQADGAIREEIGSTPLARYKYQVINYPSDSYIVSQDRAVTDIQTNSFLARDRSYWFRGGWVTRALSYDSGSDTVCDIPRVGIDEFINGVLKTSGQGERK